MNYVYQLWVRNYVTDVVFCGWIVADFYDTEAEAQDQARQFIHAHIVKVEEIPIQRV